MHRGRGNGHDAGGGAGAPAGARCRCTGHGDGVAKGTRDPGRRRVLDLTATIVVPGLVPGLAPAVAAPPTRAGARRSAQAG